MKTNVQSAAVCLTALLFLAMANAAQAQLTGTRDIDIGGLPTGGADPLDDVMLEIDLGTGGRDAIVTGVGYDVTLQANDPSWLSHAAIGFDFFLIETPGGGFLDGDEFSGTMSYSSGGIKDITMIPIGGGPEVIDLSFPAPGGILKLNLFEFFDDPGVSPDGMWLSPSTVSVAYTFVPEPATTSLLFLASVGVLCRRSRSRSK